MISGFFDERDFDLFARLEEDHFFFFYAHVYDTSDIIVSSLLLLNPFQNNHRKEVNRSFKR